MTFLQKKLQETTSETIYKQILQIDEGNLADFEKLYEKTLNSLSVNQLNTLLDYLIAKKKIAKKIKISISQKLLTHEESFLREKSVLYLEALLQKDCVPIINSLIKDTVLSVRARIFWVLAKHTIGDEELTQQIIEDLNNSTVDNDQVFLAAALYQRNYTSNSLEMRFLRDFYLENYYDSTTKELKVNLTGKFGFAAQIIGLILWEANIEIYAIDSLEMYNLQWLVEKVDEKISL